MVDQIAVVTMDSPAAPGTVDFTHPGITETVKGAYVIYSKQLTDDSDIAEGVLGFGIFADEGDAGGSARAQSRALIFRNGLTSNTQGFTNITATGMVNASDVATSCVSTTATVIAGGVRLTFTTVTMRCRITMVIFAGIDRASTGTGAAVTAGSTHEDVGRVSVGLFQPDLLIFGGVDSNLGVSNDDGSPMAGFAIRYPSLVQICAALFARRFSETPVNTEGYLRSDSFSGAYTNVGPPKTVERAVISSIDATGFNYQATGSQHNFNYLAIKFSNPSQVRLGLANMPIAASTGLQSFNAFGFTPDVVLGLSSLITAVDTPTGDSVQGASAGYFITGRGDSHAYSAATFKDPNPIIIGNPTATRSRQTARALLTLTDSSGEAHQADWAGPSGSGGFNLNFTAATVAGYMTALGIQIVPSSTIVPRVRTWAAQVEHVRRLAIAPSTKRPASFMGRVLREVARFRRAALFRRRWEPELQTFPSVPPPAAEIIDDTTIVGDNALAGSERGSNALGGAEQGDTS